MNTKNEKNQNENAKIKKDGFITFLVGMKYFSLFLAVLSGTRLASIVWQKSVLQLFVEGWTSDLMSIFLGIIALGGLGATTYFTEGKRLEREANNYNYLTFQEEERERFRKLLENK